MTTERGRILVIDDEPQIRRFLRISLVSQDFAVSEAATGREGLTLAVSQAPDLVLLDLGLPDMDGQHVLDELRRASQVPVIVVSVREQEAEKVRALDSGANDYVTKPFGIQELLARIRALLRQQSSAGSGPGTLRLRRAGLEIDLAARSVTLAGGAVHLTPKEYAVLDQLARHAGRVVTQTQLLRHVWGLSHTHDTHYLRIVISKLRHKLGDDPQSPQLLQTEAGIGYRLLVEPVEKH
ncbi:response regulator transcription factor [Halomonas sp. MCCC 1A17488]|uniref:Response regulator transcription factor n=1 Tax=Billgrantia sulfidoxydans TaxID=2733484 RepID=A0ABX7W2D8_9GAMM|nr:MULTISPECIES: response regulator transcription factor [Halomonas]MCE8016008.1 response regulator transcription factor [Halomonas sp. MCCC 1A17488]MCG3239341.1 response regulator transcription factor [Halomonas sp. MCCC 1A17488]QPP50728.1 response regulator transcription factor [Halomonas sp. SS10-MC5]QTP54305.1 response regulator transcription factor [Halomonas sulfidoxydans]